MRGIGLALCLLCFPDLVLAAAAKVEFVNRDVVATAPDGTTRPLVRGSEVEPQDLIETRSGRVQLRFTDGAYVSLSPGTRFRIDQYHYSGQPDGTEQGFFSLIKGTLRTVTGLIGKRKREAYQVTTPTATIGIRGTQYTATQDTALHVSVAAGAIVLANAMGSLQLSAGQSAIVSNANSAPVRGADVAPAAEQSSGSEEQSQEQPTTETSSTDSGTSTGTTDQALTTASTEIATTSTLTTDVVSGDQVAATPSNLLPTMTDGPGYMGTSGMTGSSTLSCAATTASPSCGNFPGRDDVGQDLTLKFENGLALVEAQDAFGLMASRGTAQSAETGTDGVLAWGRWTNGTAHMSDGTNVWYETYDAHQGRHYVVGLPTDVIPKSVQLDYHLIGATAPTSQSGTAPPGTFAGSLSLAFNAVGDYKAGFDGKVTLGGDVYKMTLDINQATTYGLSGKDFFFSPTLSVNGATPISCGTSSCPSGVAGFLSGHNASHVGITYFILDPQTLDRIVGAAAFAH